MLNATAWIIPRARSNYQNLQHAFFYFHSADDVEAALSNENLTIDKKHVTWTRTDAKLCAICSAPNHQANSCPRKCRNPSDRSVQQLYQKFQPAQYNNYKAPQKQPRGAVNPNVTFAHVTKGTDDSKEPSPNKKIEQSRRANNHNHTKNNPKSKATVLPPVESWADEPIDMSDRLFDNTICPTPSGQLVNDTMKGGSMHDDKKDDFKAFVKQQFELLNDNIFELMKTLNFTVQRVQKVEASLNIKVVTPLEAECRNLNEDPETMDDGEIEPSIDTFSSVIVKQRKTIDGLKCLNEMHQNRLKSFTTTVNTLVRSCAAFQSILIENDMLPKDSAQNLFTIEEAFD